VSLCHPFFLFCFFFFFFFFFFFLFRPTLFSSPQNKRNNRRQQQQQHNNTTHTTKQMAVYSELATVVDIIKRKTDSVDSVTRDFVFEKILSTSPITEQITASTSLETEEADFFKLQQLQQQQQQQQKEQPESGAFKGGTSNSSGVVATKVITFKADESSKFVFAKEKIEATTGVSSFPDFRPRKGDVLTIFLHGSSLSPQKPLKVTAEKTATVEEVIRIALKTYAAEQRQPPLPTTGLQLRLAEDDGTPDMDLQELNSRSQIGKLGRTFALVVGSLPGSGDGVTKKRSDTSNALTSSSSGVNIASATSGAGILVIHLPNSEKTTVQLQPELQMRLLLNRICAKRGMHPTDYHFKLVGSNSPVKLDVTLNDLGVSEIRLCPNRP